MSSRYSDRLLDHFRHPRNCGELPPPAVVVEVENPVCGDILRLWAEVAKGVVRRVRFQASGCTASIAAGSALTELLTGRPVAELRALGADAVERALDGLPAESRHAAVLCADAVKALLRAAG